MFSAHTPAAPYSDPWVQPLSARLRMLCGGKFRVAYYYEAANNSTFRYRAYNMAQVLNSDASRSISASYFFESDTNSLGTIADLADVLVVCRSGYNQAVSHWVTRFQQCGKRVLFDVDDYVFDPAFAPLLVATLGLDPTHQQVWDDWFGMMARMGQVLRMCDGAITTNAFLAQRIGQFADLPVAVVPNFMNEEQLALSRKVIDAKKASGWATDGRVNVGYFSGSPSHRLDFAVVEAALVELMDADDRIILTLVGYVEPGPELARFSQRIERHPFQDYVNLQRLVGSVEFNLMPLQSNVFTHCKSELKYFEAAVVGTVSIASPVVNYAANITHGHNGYLAKAHQWTRVLRQAIAERDHYENLAEAACQHALGRFSGPSQYTLIAEAVGASF